MSAPAAAPQAFVPRRAPGSRGKLVFVVVVALVLIGLTAWWLHQRLTRIYVDDARIDGEVVTIASRVSGWITELPVSEGDVVRRDALLVAIDDREARAQRKATTDHHAHLVVHGVLHACGHDLQLVLSCTRDIQQRPAAILLDIGDARVRLHGSHHHLDAARGHHLPLVLSRIRDVAQRRAAILLDIGDVWTSATHSALRLLAPGSWRARTARCGSWLLL